MTKGRKRIALSALLAGCLFVHQNCASLMFGTNQRIPVTSSPPGAQVTVDAKYVRKTPIALWLDKKSDHVLKIEREGYAPIVISIRGKATGALLLDGLLCFPIGPGLGVMLGLAVAPRENIDEPKAGWVVAFGVLGIAAGVAALVADAKNGAARELSPAKIEVEMKKLGEAPGPQLIVMNREQWSRVYWIRIAFEK